MHEFRCALRTFATEHRVRLPSFSLVIQIHACSEPNFTHIMDLSIMFQ